jgi:hypothetical protein
VSLRARAARRRSPLDSNPRVDSLEGSEDVRDEPVDDMRRTRFRMLLCREDDTGRSDVIS